MGKITKGNSPINLSTKSDDKIQGIKFLYCCTHIETQDDLTKVTLF